MEFIQQSKNGRQIRRLKNFVHYCHRTIFIQLLQAMKPMVMNTESGKKWTAIFYAEIEDMYTNESADTPVITLSSESVPAPPVDTGSTAIEEETMEVVEEKKEEASAPVLTSESVPVSPVDNGSTAVEKRLLVSDESSLTYKQHLGGFG